MTRWIHLTIHLTEVNHAFLKFASLSHLRFASSRAQVTRLPTSNIKAKWRSSSTCHVGRCTLKQKKRPMKLSKAFLFRVDLAVERETRNPGFMPALKRPEPAKTIQRPIQHSSNDIILSLSG